MKDEKRVAKDEAKRVEEMTEDAAFAVLGGVCMNAAIVDGFGRSETNVANAVGDGGHKQGVFAMGDVGVVTVLANNGSGDKFAARRGEEASADVEGDALKTGAALIGAGEVAFDKLPILEIEDVGFDDGAGAALGEFVGEFGEACSGEKIVEIGGAYPVVVVNEGEVASGGGVDAAVAGIGDSRLVGIEETDVRARFGVSFVDGGDEFVDAGDVGVAWSVENDENLELLGVDGLFEERFEGLPKEVLRLVCGDDDGDLHFFTKRRGSSRG